MPACSGQPLERGRHPANLTEQQHSCTPGVADKPGVRESILRPEDTRCRGVQQRNWMDFTALTRLFCTHEMTEVVDVESILQRSHQRAHCWKTAAYKSGAGSLYSENSSRRKISVCRNQFEILMMSSLFPPLLKPTQGYERAAWLINASQFPYARAYHSLPFITALSPSLCNPAFS